MFNKNKVKFQDHQLDDYVLENSVLKSKLQSKIDALAIMGKELDKSSMERDKYKELVEQLRCQKLLRPPDGLNVAYRLTSSNSMSGGEMLAKTQDHNNLLKLEVEALKSKLDEAMGDILALRKQLQKEGSNESVNVSKKMSTSSLTSSADYEQLVNELEKVQKKYQQLQLNYRATLDEKEELISDRDYYKNKVQRLNQQMSHIISTRSKVQDSDSDTPKPVIDIDTLVTENKYLNERITQLQVEKEIIKRTLTKYKSLLDNRNTKNYPVNIKKGFTDVMTQKQVREFLDSISMKSGLKQGSAAELKSLCLGLFEALNDKSIALQHQRKTNQILAKRITELEKSLESWCNGEKYVPIFPSQMLLDESFGDSASVNSDDSKEKSKVNSNNKSSSDSDDEKRDRNEFDAEKRETNEFDEQKYDNGCFLNGDDMSMKTVLPQELEELVKEALAELKPSG